MHPRRVLKHQNRNVELKESCCTHVLDNAVGRLHVAVVVSKVRHDGRVDLDVVAGRVGFLWVLVQEKGPWNPGAQRDSVEFAVVVVAQRGVKDHDGIGPLHADGVDRGAAEDGKGRKEGRHLLGCLEL